MRKDASIPLRRGNKIIMLGRLREGPQQERRVGGKMGCRIRNGGGDRRERRETQRFRRMSGNM